MLRPFRHFLFPVSVCTLLLAACSKPDGPEEVAVAFFHTLYNEHDLEAAEKMVTDASRDKLHDDFKYIEGALAVIAAEQNTTYDFRAQSEKTITSADSAFVYVWTSLDNSTTETLLLRAGDRWQVDFTYPSGQAAKKALTEEVLNVTEKQARLPETPGQ